MKKSAGVIIISIISLAAMGVFFFITGNRTRQDDTDKYQTVAWINSIPVAKGEAQLFQQTGTANEDYKEAVEELVWYKILQNELMEQGKLEDISYESFLEKLEIENTSRLEKKENGEVLYGPVQYTEKVYYEYLQETYETIWIESATVEPSEEELKKLYEEDETLYQTFGEVTFLYLSFEEDNYIKEELEQLRSEIEKAVTDGKDFNKIVAELQLEDVYDERTFTEQDLSTPDVTEYPEISQIVYTLEENEVSELIDLGNQGLIFYCQERKQGIRTPFEECKDALEEIYKENYLAKKTEEERSSAVITYVEDKK